MKRSCLLLLIGLNCVLAVTLFSTMFRLPAALAQAGAKAGSLIAVTARPDIHTFEVVWVLDPASDKLVALYPQQLTSQQLTATKPRDLAKDFGK